MMSVYAITLGFISFDILTGLIKALYKGEINSTILRTGLFHKVSEILTLFGGGLLDYSVKYVELGITAPVLKFVSIYICTMELISIIENLSEINPKLTKFFAPYLEKLKKRG